MKTQQIPGGRNVHFPDALGMIPGFGKFAGQGMGVIPADAVPVPHPAVMLLGHAGEQGGPGGNAGRDRGVSPGEGASLPLHGI